MFQTPPFSQRNFSHSNMVRQQPVQAMNRQQTPGQYNGPLVMQPAFGLPQRQNLVGSLNQTKMKSTPTMQNGGGYPVQQLIGKKEFMAPKLIESNQDVDPQVLIKFIKENQDLKTRIEEKAAEASVLKENIEQLQSLINDAADHMNEEND